MFIGSLQGTTANLDAMSKNDWTTADSLRELADAVDKDWGHAKSLLTMTMRRAASELEHAEMSLERCEVERRKAEREWTMAVVEKP